MQSDNSVSALDVARRKRYYSDETEVGLDQRGPFERDRDRLLYSSAFHRLAGVTQIVRAGELDIFHTRQQHTYKVAQIGRRLAQDRLRKQETESKLHGLDPEVVEAACLAHDLGHPPFGHAAESELNRLVCEPKIVGGSPEDKADGFEGNAQTFRILTKLAVRYETDRPGLGLTRATLAATLKYPWLRDEEDNKKKSKWSAYTSEKTEFKWAREHCVDEFKTAEAELMDWADDISYSVHDLEDFHRVGIIPWNQILNGHASNELIQGILNPWKKDPEYPNDETDATDRIKKALTRITKKLMIFPTVYTEVYSGTREQRRQLRNFTSQLIGNYVRSVTLTDDISGPAVIIESDAADEVRVLKHFARHYIIGLPALHAQQYGQKRIIRELFEIFLQEGKKENFKLFPARLRYIWSDNNDDTAARLAADCVASLSENEAYQLHHRLTGTESGIVLDPIVR